MHWFKANLKSSISAVFSSRPSPRGEPPQQSGIEDIRGSMLALVPDSQDRQLVHVGRRIRYATDLLGLWYLRGDLMAALASRDGEARAREQVHAITALFEGRLPVGLRSRPSPLSADRS